MHIIERTVIDKPAAVVWPLIVVPEHYRSWNTKIISMEAQGRFIVGQPFMTRYRMTGKEMQCISTVIEIQEERLLVIEHANCTGGDISPDLVVHERVELREAGGRTKVIKDVDVRHHGIPWLLVPVIWFVMRFGKPAEPDRLKLMAEAAA